MTSPPQRLEADGFEARYRANPDPWQYETSDYENQKYLATLAACGPGPFESAIELGGSIGVFSKLLAPNCGQLLTLDFSPTAVRRAHVRLRSNPNARVLLARIPQQLPVGRFDLIVASEVLYYLTAAELQATVKWAASSLEPGGRLVCVHWVPAGPERPLTAIAAHEMVVSARAPTKTFSALTADYLLDVFTAA